MAEIVFGALADPLVKQLPPPVANRRAWLNCCKTWQADADAIVRLSVHHHLSRTEADRARRRLLKTIQYFYRKHGFGAEGAPKK